MELQRIIFELLIENDYIFIRHNHYKYNNINYYFIFYYSPTNLCVNVINIGKLRNEKIYKVEDYIDILKENIRLKKLKNIVWMIKK